MARRQLYSLASDGEQAPLSVAQTTLDTFGAVKDVVLDSDPGKHYPPEYLVYEGLWLHAQLTPEQLCIRFPKASQAEQADTTRYLDADYRTVALAVDVLTEELRFEFASRHTPLKQGTVIALLGIPSLNLVLHALALWRLDCAVQFFNHDLGQHVMDSLLQSSREGGTLALLHAGLTEAEAYDLQLSDLEARIGVRAIEVPRRRFTSALLEEITTRSAGAVPRAPISIEEFVASSKSQLIRLVVHTSGSSGTPKISRWDLFALGCFMRPPPHIQMSPQNKAFPYLQVSRPHWTTSSFLTTYGIASGAAMALCRPANRIYPSTQEALDMVSATQSKSLLLFPAQAIELRELLKRKSERYRPILESLASLQFIGASLDSLSARAVDDLAIEGKVLILNLHGLGEIGTSSLSTTRSPYNVLYSTSEAALFEPIRLEEDDIAERKSNTGESLAPPQYVKLWISMDKHPILWYQLTQGRVPSLAIKRFPAHGPMLDRPALDTGDIFEICEMENGLRGYVHRARDDDIIRLSNLYRPNVTELESQLLQNLLDCSDSSSPNEKTFKFEDIDAIQIMGDGKPRLAAVVQLTAKCALSQSTIENCVSEAIKRLDDTLPAAVRIGGLRRTAIVTAQQSPPSLILLKTHKANLRRAKNAQEWADWLDALPEA